MYNFCIYAEILHKYAILGGGVPVLLNKHFLTKVLTFYFYVFFGSLINYTIFVIQKQTKSLTL